MQSKVSLGTRRKTNSSSSSRHSAVEIPVIHTQYSHGSKSSSSKRHLLLADWRIMKKYSNNKVYVVLSKDDDKWIFFLCAIPPPTDRCLWILMADFAVNLCLYSRFLLKFMHGNGDCKKCKQRDFFNLKIFVKGTLNKINKYLKCFRAVFWVKFCDHCKNLSSE